MKMNWFYTVAILNNINNNNNNPKPVIFWFDTCLSELSCRVSMYKFLHLWCYGPEPGLWQIPRKKGFPRSNFLNITF